MTAAGGWPWLLAVISKRPSTERWLFGAAPPEVRARWQPFVLPRFPLTLAGWLNAAVGAGLVVEMACEPRADEAVARCHPEVADTRIAPYFFLLRARKLVCA